MNFKDWNLVFILILGIAPTVYGKAIAELGFNEESASQQTLYRRSPYLSLQSMGYGGGGTGNGQSGAMSTTSLQLHNDNNYSNNGNLSVQSTAVGGAGGGGDGTGPGGTGGSMATTGLQFSGGNNPNNNDLNVQSTAVGGNSGPGGTGGSMATTGLQFSGGNNPNNNDLNVQSTAAGGNSGPGGTGGSMATTGLQFSGGNNSNNNKLSVQSNAVGVGGGDNNLGASQTTLQTTDNVPAMNPNQDTDALNAKHGSVGINNGNDGAVGATQTSLETDIDHLKIDNTAIGATDGNQAVGLSSTQVHENDHDNTVDVKNTALGTGDNAGAITNTSVQQKDVNGSETKVDTTSLGYGSGPDTVGANQSTVNINKDHGSAGSPVPAQQNDYPVQVQNSGVGETNKNGTVDINTNSVHIGDEKEGDIDLKTLTAGSSNNGGVGVAGVDVKMADGADTTPNNDFKVKSTNTAIGGSDQGVGGSVSTVQIDDKKNERSLEAQTVGLGYTDNNSSGTLTADSMKYHDVDQEKQTVINPNNGSVVQSSTHEVNDISSQNLSSQYKSVNDDGTHSTTTHSTTTQTHQTQVMQKSYTEQQIINQQNVVGYSSLNQQNQQVNQNQSILTSSQNQQNQQVSQNQSILTSQQSQNIQNQKIASTEQQSQTLVQNSSQMTSTQQSQTLDQNQSYSLGSQQINLPKWHHASPLLCPDNNQGPGVVCHYEVASVFEYDDNYVLRPSQIMTEYCDVLVVSYAVLDIDRLQIGAFSQDEERVFSEIASLKSDKLKIILQLQYVAFYEQYITILNCEDNLNRFTSSVIKYLQKWNFDGIELPIMIPQSNDNFYETSPVVKEKFPILVQKLRSNLRNDQIISVCLPIEPDYIDFAYDIPKLVKQVDWFSVITLDYNVPDQGILQHTSPLTPQTSSDPYCIDFTVNYLLSDLNVPSDKVIINVPLYGASFVLENYKNPSYGAKVTGRGPKGPSSNVDGFLTVSELCSVRQLNWLNSPAIVTDYDDVPTLILKVTYAKYKCLGGVGIHSISMDDPEGQLCGQGVMPFTRVISMAYDPTRDVFDKNDTLQVANFIDKSSTNKYDV